MKAASATPPFAFELGDNGHARLSNGRITLVRFLPRWPCAFYVVLQRGPERGLERWA